MPQGSALGLSCTCCEPVTYPHWDSAVATFAHNTAILPEDQNQQTSISE